MATPHYVKEFSPNSPPSIHNGGLGHLWLTDAGTSTAGVTYCKIQAMDASVIIYTDGAGVTHSAKPMAAGTEIVGRLTAITCTTGDIVLTIGLTPAS